MKKEYAAEDMNRLLLSLCQVCFEEKERLTDIDSHLGDGDMGISMSRGAAAVESEIKKWDGRQRDMTKMVLNYACAFNRAAPSTLGTLLSFSMMAVAKEIDHREKVEENQLPFLAKTFADTICRKGKAKEGDKTILDALLPWTRCFECEMAAGKSLQESLGKASDEALAGMERTKGMEARTGRASWLDGRNKEYPDGGAVLCAAAGRKMAGQGRLLEE